jgi:hypothetical protein
MPILFCTCGATCWCASSRGHRWCSVFRAFLANGRYTSSSSRVTWAAAISVVELGAVVSGPSSSTRPSGRYANSTRPEPPSPSNSSPRQPKSPDPGSTPSPTSAPRSNNSETPADEHRPRRSLPPNARPPPTNATGNSTKKTGGSAASWPRPSGNYEQPEDLALR